MSLVDEIRALRDRSLAELNDAHDYYANTKAAWDMVENAIASGPSFSIRNSVTGSVTTAKKLADKASDYVANELTEATFQQFIVIFESFFFDFLRHWLLAYPQILHRRTVDFKTILEAPDKDALALVVVDKELNDILYDRPVKWFAYLEDRANLGCPAADEIERIAEAKATRDVLVHNRGVASKTYEAKAGTLSRFKAGERIDLPDDYHRRTWELLRKVVADISEAAVAKLT